MYALDGRGTRKRIWQSIRSLLLWIACCALNSAVAADGPVDVIARVKASIVGVGTFDKSRSPPFQFLGTGFVLGDGSLVATNSHVLPQVLDTERREVVAIGVPGVSPESPGSVRAARVVAIDEEHDLALLRIEGAKLPALALADSSQVREGQSYLFTGFPIGTVLGLVPTTHRAMISAVTAIAIPTGNARDLEPRMIKRLSSAAYGVLQLDATAYPGNSGSPLYDPTTGNVVGIINMVAVKGTRETALSQPSGISYAIPALPLKTLLQTVK